MATTSSNNVQIAGKIVYGVRKNDGTFDFNQGDLIYSDSGIAKPITSDANCSLLMGVARLANPIDPNVYGNAIYPEIAEADFGGVYLMKTTNAENYVHDQLVYFGGDAQTITNVAGAMINPIGRVNLPDGSTLVGTVGGNVPVRVVNRSITTLAIA
jgi:hypothetical protein